MTHKWRPRSMGLAYVTGVLVGASLMALGFIFSRATKVEENRAERTITVAGVPRQFTEQPENCWTWEDGKVGMQAIWTDAAGKSWCDVYTLERGVIHGMRYPVSKDRVELSDGTQIDPRADCGER